jgi:hypothetical protein
MPKELPPLTDEFIKAGLSKGWLIPPRNERRATPTERLLLRVFWIMIIIGAGCLAVAWFAIRYQLS